MRFPPSFLEEIKARLPMSQVAGRRVRLKKEGREWRGLSPFTAEKTPSFYVNDQKARFFDFSAGKNGNIFDFVMETEGVSFPDHSHCEQRGLVIAGEMTIEIDGQTNLYQAGDTYVVPDGVRHRATFSKPTVLIDMSDAPDRFSVYR